MICGRLSPTTNSGKLVPKEKLMATSKKQAPVVGDGTQNAVIVNALADRRWHSLAELRRILPNAAINSRISELRKEYDLKIERRILTGKPRRELAVQYQLSNPPRPLPKSDPVTPLVEQGVVLLSEMRTILDRDAVPRDRAHRHRIYRLVRNEPELVFAVSTPAKVGTKLYEMGLKEEFAQSCVGWLDTYALPKGDGKWVINPWDAQPLKTR